ncbi:hypothetical protein ACFRMQ_00090 [Kitasatospora sp. NPDC056783]|uniref:hypothetical protein n=1 Tax=Kitasatospora sp. NPDC056783 TaxID=3345943 RepID=UPI003686A89D
MTRQDPVPPLTTAQRQALLSADEATGEVAGIRSVLDALVGSRLAIVYGRRGAVYLTPAGRILRARLASGPEVPAAPADDRGFRPATGDGLGAPAAGGDRVREVEQAWAGVMEIRRLNGSAGAPAPWELARREWSVSLALEAAGIPSSAVDGRGRRVRSGCRVVGGLEAGEVRVEWRGPDSYQARREAPVRLQECLVALAACGWEATLYQRSGGEHFLTVVPMPAAGA